MGAAGALAHRYARALLDVALEQDSDGAVAAALGAELRGFAALVSGHHDLSRALAHPSVATEAKRRVLAALTEAGGASTLLRRLLEVVVSGDRLALLPALAEAYAERLRARRGVVAAEAVSAVPLPEDQRRDLVEALAGATGRSVELETRTDPALLGGLLLRMDGKTYDGTVRSRLAALRRRLAAGA